jgi:8-oxo-dGTP diphosphatase
VQRYIYPHAHVELHFFRVFAFDGEPVGHDGQSFAWQTPGRFTVAPLLPANTRVLRALLLPAIYGITMADDLGEEAFLARARVALDRGLKLIQLREKDWSAARQRAFAGQLGELAAHYDADVLLNGDAEHARAWNCAGVHWTADALATARERPADLLCAASCHTRNDLDKAAALGLDFVVLGPVLPTPMHPDTSLLYWDRFAAIASGAMLPVYAIGGLTHGDLDVAITHGAHGIALRRAAWSVA